MSSLSNVVEIVCKGIAAFSTGGNKRIENVFHYALVSGPAQTAGAVLEQWLGTKWNAVAPLLSVDYTGDTSVARYLDNALENYQDRPNTNDGAVTGDRLPLDMAVCAVYRCAERGKNFRGSKHFGPIGESATLADELTGAAVTAWNAALVYLLSDINLGGAVYSPVVISRNLSQLRVNPTTIIGSPVIDIVLNKTIGTLRRRRQRISR